MLKKIKICDIMTKTDIKNLKYNILGGMYGRKVC